MPQLKPDEVLHDTVGQMNTNTIIDPIDFLEKVSNDATLKLDAHSMSIFKDYIESWESLEFDNDWGSISLIDFYGAISKVSVGPYPAGTKFDYVMFDFPEGKVYYQRVNPDEFPEQVTEPNNLTFSLTFQINFS